MKLQDFSKASLLNFKKIQWNNTKNYPMEKYERNCYDIFSLFNAHNKDVSYFQITLYRTLKNSSRNKILRKVTLLKKLTQTAYDD